MDGKYDWLLRVVIVLAVILFFIYIGVGCNATIVVIENDVLCEYLGHEGSRITWTGLLDGTGDYTAECVDYVPLE